MRKLYSPWILVVCIVLPFLAAGQTISIPDANFEQALIDLGIDSDGQVNGSVATEDISPVTTLDVSSKSIQTLTGIEGFVNLEDLNCSNNVIQSLNLNNNAKLERLLCNGNRIEALSVRSNPELRFLRAGKNLIGEINLSDNTKLEQAYLNDNLLTSLNVRSNANLKVLDCSSNLLQTINVTDNLLLEQLDFSTNSIPEIDLFQNFYLASLDISDNPLTSIILFNLIRLREFHAEGNDLLTRIDFDQTHALEYISCHDNENLAVIETRGTLALKYLNCSGNQLTELDLSQNEFLESLYCQNNKLSALDLSLNAKLGFLHCNSNLLEVLNLKNGHNDLMTGGLTEYEGEVQYMAGLNATGNAQLQCIQVDNAADAMAGTAPYDSWLKDDFASYSEDCQAALDVVDYELDRMVQLFPNPVQDRIHIKSSEQPITRVTVYSVLGNTVRDVHSGFRELTLNDLKPGVYFVRITLENGIVSRTLIKN